MSVFTPLEVTPYTKASFPDSPQSQRLYLDQQLRELSRSITSLTNAVEQLQAEQALIWTELTALGRPRP